MSNTLSDADLRRIAEKNAANIEAIAKTSGHERALTADTEASEAVAKAFGFGSGTEKSDGDGVAAQVRRNAENLAILADRLGVSKRDIDGSTTKHDTSKAADVLLGDGE